MKQTTFIADGKTKNFHFTFPFFLKSDVIIEVDSQPARNYYLMCLKNGLNADIPFGGGQVRFKQPPKLASVITIRRVLPLTRIVDYQPTAPYNANALNQDFNYLMEVLKDLKSELNDFDTKFSEITNKESIDIVLERITVVMSAIDIFAKQIENLGDITSIHTSIAALNSTITGLNNTITEHSSDITTLQNSVGTLNQRPVYTIPDYSDAGVSQPMTTDTWHEAIITGMLHIALYTNNVISWLTLYLGNETNSIPITIQVNSNERGFNALYPIKAGQKFKLCPRGCSISSCKIIPFC